MREKTRAGMEALNSSEIWLKADVYLNGKPHPESAGLEAKWYRNLGVIAERNGWTGRERTDRVCEFAVWLRCTQDGWQDEPSDDHWQEFMTSDLYLSLNQPEYSSGELLDLSESNIPTIRL